MDTRKLRKPKNFVNLPVEAQFKYHTKVYTAPIYDHFTVRIQRRSNGDVMRNAAGHAVYEFVCKGGGGIVRRHNMDGSTSNLIAHRNTCTHYGFAGHTSGPMDPFTNLGVYTTDCLRALVTVWLVNRHCPFSILADPELLDIVKLLNRTASLPHPVTASKDCRDLHDYVRGLVKERLQKHVGAIHLGFDTWLAGNKMSFLGITAHYVVDGVMQKLLLDFVRITEAHTGENLANRVIAVCEEFGILEKIIGTVCDNASNMDKLVEYLRESPKLPLCQGPVTRARCFPHILNLVLKAFMSPFRPFKKEDRDLDDDSTDGGDTDADEAQSEADADIDADADADADADGADLAGSEEFVELLIEEAISEVELPNLLLEEQRQAMGTLAKVKKLVKRIHYNDTLRTNLKANCRLHGLEVQLASLPRDVKTRWNYTLIMIGAALKVRDPLDDLCKQHRKDKTLTQLDEEEWDLLRLLSNNSQVFIEATHMFSQGNTPLIFEVIPVIDALQTHFDRIRNNDTLPAAIRHGAARTSIVLSKYYALTDDSEVYRIAMLLHPEHKTTYWTKQEWPPNWIATGIRMGRDVWKEHYEKPASTLTSTSTLEPAPSEIPTLFAIRRSTQTLAVAESAFDAWVRAPIFACANPLAYWTGELSNPDRKALARMALDYLSIPAASVDVERAFSVGGLIVSDRRHRLCDKSIRASVLLGSWTQAPNVVSSHQIRSFFRKKIGGKRAQTSGLDERGEDKQDPIEID